MKEIVEQVKKNDEIVTMKEIHFQKHQLWTFNSTLVWYVRLVNLFCLHEQKNLLKRIRKHLVKFWNESDTVTNSLKS